MKRRRLTLKEEEKANSAYAPGDGQPQPPTAAQPQAQAGPSGTQGAPAQQRAPPFGDEVREMFKYIRGAALKGAEIVRYQSDMKQLERAGGQPAPVPKHILVGFRQDTERLDQVCDIIEAKILRLMSVLVREINRHNAKAAEEAAAKAALEKEQAEAAAALASEAASTETIKTEDTMDIETQPETQPTDAEKMPPPPNPNPQQSLSSTAPSVVSLSALPSSSPDLSESAAADQANKGRLARNFSLKLDLSAPSLRGPDPPSSPVRLAPQSAKPRADDAATSAFGLIGAAPGPFNLALMQQLAAQPPTSAFASNASLPFGTSANPTDTNALIPDILSSVNAAASQQAVSAATQSDGSLQPFTGDVQDVIDLTGNSPMRGQMGMPINVDTDGPAETIDLTMDSPMIPLAQLAKKASEDTATKAEDKNPAGEGQPAEPATVDASLEGLVSSLAGSAQSTNGDLSASSLLATLTNVTSNPTAPNSNNNDASTPGSNVFQGLIPSNDFSDLSGMGLESVDLSSMFLSQAGGGAGTVEGGASAAGGGIFEGFDLMGGDPSAGGAGSMDFDTLFGGMGGDGSGA